MGAAFHQIGIELRHGWRGIILCGLGFAILSQVLMLIALVARFGALPNYVTFYDWVGNAIHIVRSTPSWVDMAPIIAEEWLIEIGRMNYDYGNGISEWSLNVIPSRLVVLFGLGTLVGLCLGLARRSECDGATRGGAAAATGVGAILVAMTNATMSWVVCCATPSWVVGLAMMGLGVSTSLALQTLGPVLSLGGFAVLIMTALVLGWRKAARSHISLETRHA